MIHLENLRSQQPPFEVRRRAVCRDLLGRKEYEKKATEIVLGDNTHVNKREALNTLIDEFIEKALTEKTK